MSIFRSHKHTYVQLIDDLDGKTVASASSKDGDLQSAVSYGGNKAAATAIGKAIAELAAGVPSRAAEVLGARSEPSRPFPRFITELGVKLTTEYRLMRAGDEV